MEKVTLAVAVLGVMGAVGVIEAAEARPRSRETGPSS